MCGIFGFISRKGQIPPGLLEYATGSLAHRGPDDSGTVLLQEEGPNPIEIGLGHRRLAILDLSPLGHQPMQDPVSGNWIVFNGEIYNFRALRKKLEAAGVEFKSHSDTEVILASYRVWGDSCVLQLEGMFAFVLWDVARQRLLLVRDPMGIKPLYYHHTENYFIFASEVRTLVKTNLVPRKVDPTGVLSFLEFGSVYEPWTIIEGVSALPPGHILSLENGLATVHEYWNPLPVSSAEPERPGENVLGVTSRLPAILRDAVLSHLVSDVPVGVFLSGGIDSSALVAVLNHNGVRAETFSLIFEEEEFNEGQHSREISRRYGTEHHEISISQQETLAILPHALGAMDQPTIDGINTYLVSAKTRDAGVKVALTGLGADEMFGGYSNFRRVPKMEAFLKRFRCLPDLARQPFAAFMTMFAGKNDRLRKFAALASGHEPALHPYFLARMLFGAAEREALLPGPHYSAIQKSINLRLQQSVAACESLDPVNRVSYLESSFYMRNTLLRDADFMSMAHGLELRVPFLDRALVEACFRIPGGAKLKGNSPKSLLLASLGVELPSDIVNRPKRGFTLPFGRWLRGEMRAVVEKTLLNGDGGSSHVAAKPTREVWSQFLSGKTSWTRPWSLFVLQRWCEQNL